MRPVSFVLLTLLSVASSHPHPVPLHLGALLPLTGSGWPIISPESGQALLLGAQLAIEDINSNDNILSGYRLIFVHRDTKNDPGWGVNGFNDLVSNGPTKLMITGSITSDDTLPVALATKTYNLVQCLPLVRSPFFSDRQKFPRLFEVSSSDGQFLPAMKYFLKDSSCISKKIGFVYDMNEHLSDEYTKGLQLELQKDPSIEIEMIEGYRGNASVAMENLKTRNIKVIVISIPSFGSNEIFCEAYKKGLYGQGYTWIWVGYRLYIEELVKQSGSTDCTFKQIKKVLVGSRYFSYHHEVPDLDDVISSGKTVREYEDRYLLQIGHVSEIRSSKTVYDCVLASALALNSSLSNLPYGKRLEDFDYQDSAMADVFTQSMQNLSYDGLTGHITFDCYGARIDDTVIGKIKKNLERHPRGIFDVNSGVINWYNHVLKCKN